MIADRDNFDVIFRINHVFVSRYFHGYEISSGLWRQLLCISLFIFIKAKDKSKKSSFGSAMMLFEPEAEYGVKKPEPISEIVDKLSKAYKKDTFP